MEDMTPKTRRGGGAVVVVGGAGASQARQHRGAPEPGQQNRASRTGRTGPDTKIPSKTINRLLFHHSPANKAPQEPLETGGLGGLHSSQEASALRRRRFGRPTNAPRVYRKPSHRHNNRSVTG